MPIRKNENAKNIILCNLDTKSGYGGVTKPLYDSESTIMILGDAKETVAELTASL